MKPVRVSEAFHERLAAHERDDETVAETLRRITRGPHPGDVTGLQWDADAEEAKEASEWQGNRNRDRFAAARDAVGTGDVPECRGTVGAGAEGLVPVDLLPPLKG